MKIGEICTDSPNLSSQMALPKFSMKYGLLLVTTTCEFTALPQKPYLEAPTRVLLSNLDLGSWSQLSTLDLDQRRSTLVDFLHNITLGTRTPLLELEFFNLS